MILDGQPIRTAIVGYGFSGRRIHAPLLEVLSGFRVDAIVARSDGAQALAAVEHPDAAVVRSLQELRDEPKRYDLVVIATPDDSHTELATAALEGGVHVVVDKPLAASSADAVRLTELARSRMLQLATFQNKRWDADFLAVAEVVRRGMIGAVTRYDSWITRWSPEIGSTWRERSRPGTLDGRLADLGSHLVDQSVSLLGPVVHCYAELDRRRPGAQTNDDVFLALTHANGVRSHLHMGSVTSHPTPTFQVQGLAGSIVTTGRDGQFAALAHEIAPSDPDWRSFDDWTAQLVLGAMAAPVPTVPGDWLDFYRGLERSLREGVALPVDPHQVIHVLRVLEAAVASDATGSTAEVLALGLVKEDLRGEGGLPSWTS